MIIKGAQLQSGVFTPLNETVFFWFSSNNTSGSASDGTTAIVSVRKAGEVSTAAPILQVTPVLLSHTSYPNGCYEAAIDVTSVNGFVIGGTYAVFATLLVDLQNPSGFLGYIRT